MSGVDPGLLRLVEQVVNPGDVIWDIGANLGLFTFAAASQTGPQGRVIAIEPDATLVTLLRRSARSNKETAPVDILPVAVADEVTVRSFTIAKRNRATSHLAEYGTTQTGGARATELVPAVTLDWLSRYFPLPNVLKIDVEEAEIEVLRAADQVLNTQPIVICEVASRNAREVAQILQRYEYSIYDSSLPAQGQPAHAAAPPTTLALPHSL